MNQFSKDGVKKGRADGERAESIGFICPPVQLGS